MIVAENYFHIASIWMNVRSTTALLAINILIIFALSHFSAHAASTADTIDNLTQQWLDIEKQSQQLATHWQLSKPTLKQRIQLLEAEKSQLISVLSESQTKERGVEKKREALLAQQNAIEAQQTKLVTALSTLTRNVAAIKSQLPEILVSQWEKESATLSSNPSASEQLQVTLAQLDALQKFNSKVTVHEALMQVTDKQRIWVKQLFLGNKVAWFSNANGDYFGVGHVQNGQWIWTFKQESESPDFSREIQSAIAMYEKQKAPDFVSLPVLTEQEKL